MSPPPPGGTPEPTSPPEAVPPPRAGAPPHLPPLLQAPLPSEKMQYSILFYDRGGFPLFGLDLSIRNLVNSSILKNYVTWYAYNLLITACT